MTIYDLPSLDPDKALASIRRTLELYPILKEIYDDDCIMELVRERSNTKNSLLLRLVQPDEPAARAFWAPIAADLEILRDEGSVEVFRHKLRSRELHPSESAKSELNLAAWVKRRGVVVQLEPETNPPKNCDFSARTDPQAWWEIKTLADTQGPRSDDRVAHEVMPRLRRFPEPYVLSVQFQALRLEKVHDAVKEIKRQLSALHQESEEPPLHLEAHGLVVDAIGTTEGDGYVGMWEAGYEFEDENAEQVMARIRDAIPQLPAGKPGIAVIDTTVADWIEYDDVEDACLGPEVTEIVGGDVRNRHLANGIFTPNHFTRLSAVAHYSRRKSDAWSDFEMTLIHNPFAASPIPLRMFEDDPRVREIHLRPAGEGRFLIERSWVTPEE